MPLTGFHPSWDKFLSQNLQAVADQGCHLEGSSPYKGTAYRGVYFPDVVELIIQYILVSVARGGRGNGMNQETKHNLRI
jgi:hypothetical protein